MNKPEEQIYIEFNSIKIAYETYNEEFKKNIEKGYKNTKKYSALNIYATELDNIYFYSYEYIEKAKKINAEYSHIINNLKNYTTDFIIYYENLKVKNKNNQEFIKDVNNIKKHLQYVNKYL